MAFIFQMLNKYEVNMFLKTLKLPNFYKIYKCSVCFLNCQILILLFLNFKVLINRIL